MRIFLLLMLLNTYLMGSCNSNKNENNINEKNADVKKTDVENVHKKNVLKKDVDSQNLSDNNDSRDIEQIKKNEGEDNEAQDNQAQEKYMNKTEYDKIFYFAFYNVENLFDTEDDPKTEDSEFTPEGKNKWNEKKLDKKLSNISYAIKAMNDRELPDVLGLAEIENYNILNRLVTEYLPQDFYGIAHFDSPDNRGIDVALIYKKSEFKLVSQKAHTVDLGEDERPTRDILEVTLEHDSKQFTVLVNHWPSRREGQLASEHKRIKAAMLCASIIDSIYQKQANADIVIMGDMNDEPFDKSLVDALDAEDFNKEKYLATNKFNPRAINTAAKTAKNSGIGSHFYDNSWAVLDQIIVSKGLLSSPGLVLFDMNENIFAPDFLRDDFNPRYRPPYRTFVGSKFIKGYSDHFPVYLKIGWKK